jgi:hypothetical protein
MGILKTIVKKTASLAGDGAKAGKMSPDEMKAYTARYMDDSSDAAYAQRMAANEAARQQARAAENAAAAQKQAPRPVPKSVTAGTGKTTPGTFRSSAPEIQPLTEKGQKRLDSANAKRETTPELTGKLTFDVPEYKKGGRVTGYKGYGKAKKV